MKNILNILIKEKNIYKFWLKNKLFNPNNKNIKHKKNFSIIMPPPNITGNLHLGHAYQQAIMDLIIRYKKMSGFNTIWLTGIDHAGISTQIIVENYLKKKYKIYDKKKLIKELWKWKYKYEYKIYKETKLLGNSIFWKSKKFTLDKNYSKAVKKAFIILYKKKLIYQDYKIINWDVKIKTVLSDIEIYKKKKKVKQYFIKYKLYNTKNKYIIIPTTKPELLLSNTAILTNDKTIKKYKFIINPINNIKLPIILKKKKNIKYYINLTPGHKISHFKKAKKKKINIINILKKNGNLKKKINILNYKCIKIKNNIKNIYKNKKQIIKFLINNKYIYKTIKIIKPVSYSTKTNTKIIKILTKQWFLKMKSLTKNCFKYIKYKKIIFIPNKYKNLLFSWIKNIQDWCISRQICWGHKIPIWYDKFKKIYLGYNKKHIIKKYNLNKNIYLKQDINILDTWFSSSIWTLTSLGWPKNFSHKFHPINLIVSGFDIIYFWIARMIIITPLLLNKSYNLIPFKKVLITGLITDENGNKMSKSTGNIITPKDIIYGISLKNLIIKRTKYLIKNNLKKKIINNTKKYFPNGIPAYGTDILRYTLYNISSNKLKINFNFQFLKNSYNFCNKLLNISKFIIKFFKNNKNLNYNIKNIINFNYKYIKKNLINYWILYKFNKLLKQYKKLIKNFKFQKLCIKIQKFLITIFCNWFIELFKKIFKYKKSKYISINNLIILKIVFINIILINHPIIPFLTEYIWKKIIFINNIFNKKKPSILSYKIIKYINYSKYKNKKTIYIFNIIKNIIKILKKNKINNIKKLIIINLSKTEKKIIKKNIYLLKIYYIKKIKFKIIKKLNKFKNIINIKNNIYINIKSE